MSFEEIRKMIGRVNPFVIRDAIMHSSYLSDLERAKLIGLLVRSQQTISPYLTARPVR